MRILVVADDVLARAGLVASLSGQPDVTVDQAAPEVAAEELTPRELQVLQLLAEGLPNKRVALQLGISEHTVKFHVAVIFSKLDAHGRTEAVTRAARLGLIVL